MKNKKITIIYGAGNAGVRLAKKLKLNEKINFFVDDDLNKVGKKFFKNKGYFLQDFVSMSKENSFKFDSSYSIFIIN